MDELGEWLGVPDDTEVEENLVPEAGVQEVQYRVLAAADVEVDGHPFVVAARAPGFGVVAGVEVTQVVPARAGPLRHRVRLPRVPASVLQEEAPVAGARQRSRRVGAGLEVLEVRQLERKRALGDGDRSVVVDHGRSIWPARVTIAGHGEVNRNGLTPVPLPREDPVAHAIGDLRAPLPRRREPGRDAGHARFGARSAVRNVETPRAGTA